MRTKITTATSLALSLVLSLAVAGNASATQVPATLNDEALAPGVSLQAGSPAPNGSPTAFTVFSSLPASATYGNAFSCSNCGNDVLVTDGGSAFNFYDDYVFSVGPSTVDAVSSSISLSKLLTVDNLEMRLYTYDGATSLPVLGNSPPGLKSGGAIGGWSAPISFSAGSEQTSLTVLNDVMLGSGTYVLEVRGDVIGTAGGSYSGLLNVAPVPVPAALPLMLSGLGLLGGVVRKRLAS
jgi:hypothetical protein